MAACLSVSVMMPGPLWTGYNQRVMIPARSVLACLLLLPALAQAQEQRGRAVLEAGIVSGNTIACTGHYAAIESRVAGPVSAYGMVESYRCVDVPWKSSQCYLHC